MKMVSLPFNISIDISIAAPDHEKDIVDVLSTIDKRYVRGEMSRLSKM